MTAPLDLAHLRSLLAAATPGPWRHVGDRAVVDAADADPACVTKAKGPGRYCSSCDANVFSIATREDAAFIAALVNAAPALLAAAESASDLLHCAFAEPADDAGGLAAMERLKDALLPLSGSLDERWQVFAALASHEWAMVAGEIEAAPATPPADSATPTAHLRAAATPPPWYARGRLVTRSDGGGMGAEVPGETVATFATREDAAFVVGLVNATPPADEPGALAGLTAEERATVRAMRLDVHGLAETKTARANDLLVVLDAAERLDTALLAEQRARVAAEAALVPFAARADRYDRDNEKCGRYPDDAVLEMEHRGDPGHLTVGDLRRARAAAPSPPAPVVASARERELAEALVYVRDCGTWKGGGLLPAVEIVALVREAAERALAAGTVPR